MSVKILRLNLKRKWWEQIRDGGKTVELRRATDFWRKRLVGKHYDEIHLCLGYPKRDDATRILRRKWRGYAEVNLTHVEFGSSPVDLFAIHVAEEVLP